jgi:hypothetical protein
MKEIRGIDLDEVLFETVDQLLVFHNYKINGKKINKEDISDYHIYIIKEFNINKEDAVNWFSSFSSSEDVHKTKPVTGAKESLEILKKR